MNWHYRFRQGENQVGPVTWEQLIEAVRIGRIGPLDYVWGEGMPEWREAYRVPEIAAAMPNLPPGLVNPPPIPQEGIGDNAGIRMLLPVGRSGWAIASGYLGLLSLLCIFGPFAILTGILALRDIKRNPKLHGKGRAIFGIVMGSLGTILMLFSIVSAIISAGRH